MILSSPPSGKWFITKSSFDSNGKQYLPEQILDDIFLELYEEEEKDKSEEICQLPKANVQLKEDKEIAEYNKENKYSQMEAILHN
uniref:Uncharacterized protein n=1 Tax=Rhizophagus irregularis (strain DAOM 181602 / DAOM 197198 / MUCL 43194) TaxID=747089 RepID=U9TMV6_RHIID